MKILFTIIIFIALIPSAFGKSGLTWVYDENDDCGIYYELTNEKDYVLHWTGRCLNGKAHGSGIALFYMKDTPGNWSYRIEGNVERGKLEGQAFLVQSPSTTALVNYQNSVLHGKSYWKNKKNKFIHIKKYAHGKLDDQKTIDKSTTSRKEYRSFEKLIRSASFRRMMFESTRSSSNNQIIDSEVCSLGLHSIKADLNANKKVVPSKYTSVISCYADSSNPQNAFDVHKIYVDFHGKDNDVFDESLAKAFFAVGDYDKSFSLLKKLKVSGYGSNQFKILDILSSDKFKKFGWDHTYSLKKYSEKLSSLLVKAGSIEKALEVCAIGNSCDGEDIYMEFFKKGQFDEAQTFARKNHNQLDLMYFIYKIFLQRDYESKTFYDVKLNGIALEKVEYSTDNYRPNKNLSILLDANKENPTSYGVNLFLSYIYDVVDDEEKFNYHMGRIDKKHRKHLLNDLGYIVEKYPLSAPPRFLIALLDNGYNPSTSKVIREKLESGLYRQILESAPRINLTMQQSILYLDALNGTELSTSKKEDRILFNNSIIERSYYAVFNGSKALKMLCAKLSCNNLYTDVIKIWPSQKESPVRDVSLYTGILIEMENGIVSSSQNINHEEKIVKWDYEKLKKTSIPFYQRLDKIIAEVKELNFGKKGYYSDGDQMYLFKDRIISAAENLKSALSYLLVTARIYNINTACAKGVTNEHTNCYRNQFSKIESMFDELYWNENDLSNATALHKESYEEFERSVTRYLRAKADAEEAERELHRLRAEYSRQKAIIRSRYESVIRMQKETLRRQLNERMATLKKNALAEAYKSHRYICQKNGAQYYSSRNEAGAFCLKAR